MSINKPISFSTTQRDFTNTLNKRVNDYFKSNGINKHANSEMILKTIFMFTLYFLPYALIVTEVVTALPALILLVVVMSIGLAGIGLSVMHDANHGAYSNKKWMNTLIGYSLNMVGANAFNWKIQHNVYHHTYTNVHEEDEDISPRGVLRMEPHAEWKKIHKFQHIYAWPLYGLMTIVWLFYKDFVRLVKYHQSGIAAKQNANIVNEWAILLGTKFLYVGYKRVGHSFRHQILIRGLYFYYTVSFYSACLVADCIRYHCDALYRRFLTGYHLSAGTCN